MKWEIILETCALYGRIIIQLFVVITRQTQIFRNLEKDYNIVPINIVPMTTQDLHLVFWIPFHVPTCNIPYFSHIMVHVDLDALFIYFYSTQINSISHPWVQWCWWSEKQMERCKIVSEKDKLHENKYSVKTNNLHLPISRHNLSQHLV